MVPLLPSQRRHEQACNQDIFLPHNHHHHSKKIVTETTKFGVMKMLWKCFFRATGNNINLLNIFQFQGFVICSHFNCILAWWPSEKTKKSKKADNPNVNPDTIISLWIWANMSLCLLSCKMRIRLWWLCAKAHAAHLRHTTISFSSFIFLKNCVLESNRDTFLKYYFKNVSHWS